MKYDFLYDRMKEGRKRLFDKDDECLKPLQSIMSTQSRATLVLWALELAEETVDRLEDLYPNAIKKPKAAVMNSWLYECGFKDIMQARKSVMDCHLAVILMPKECEALFHAVAEACKVVYLQKYIIRYPCYDLTSIVLKNGVENCESLIDERIHYYENKLLSISSKGAAKEIKRTKSILQEPNRMYIKNSEMNIMTNKDIFDKAVKDIETLIKIKNYFFMYAPSRTRPDILSATDHAIEAIRSTTAFKFYNFGFDITGTNPIMEILILSYTTPSKEFKSSYEDITIESNDDGSYNYHGDASYYRYPEFAMIKYFCDKYNRWDDECVNFQFPSDNK